MKKIISLVLSLLLFILCVPCSNIYGNQESALLEINFCGEDGNNNQHIIYEDGELVDFEWENSTTGTIEGLEVDVEQSDEGVYTYTIQIYDDVDLYFNAFTARDLFKQAQENKLIVGHVFSNCINVHNACLKIESIDGDHTLNIHFLNSDLDEDEMIYCIKNFAPYCKEELAGCDYEVRFGGADNQLTINFSCDNYDEDLINPVVGAFDVNGTWDGNTSYTYYTYFNNFKSKAELTGCYFTYLMSGELTRATFENGCDIEFTNIDPFDELPNGMEEGYDRGFLRLNAEAYFYDSKINAYLNDTEIEIDDCGIITNQIPNVGIASNTNITFKDSEIHMEGIAAVATYQNIIIDNTKAEFVGRLAGIISVCMQPNCIQYINPGSDSYLVIETKESTTKPYEFNKLQFNGAAAIVPGQIIQQLFADVHAEGSKDVNGNEFKPLSDIDASEYGNLKRIKVGSPFDFEFRYGEHNDKTYSCKYYEGEPLDGTDPLPYGITLDYHPENNDYPYVMTTTANNPGDFVTVACDINNKFEANYITDSHELGYSIYYDKGLLIQGDGIEFSLNGTPEEDIYYYNIISNNETAKLKIDVPKLYFTPNIYEEDFNKVEYKIENEDYFDLPYLFNISGYDISINNVEEGRFTGLYSCIEYYKKLSFINTNMQFWLYPFKFAYGEDQNENLSLYMIMSDLEGEDYDSEDIYELIINGCDLSFEGNSYVNKYNNNVDVSAIISMNFNNAALSNFEVIDSEVSFEDVGVVLGNATFTDCDKLEFTNDVKDFPNITSYGGDLNFINSNYTFNSKASNIDYIDLGEEMKIAYDAGYLTEDEFNLFYPILHVDFALNFDQDEEHFGTFESDVACINIDKGTVNISDNTKIMANTLLDGAVEVEYDDNNRTLYKYLSVEHLTPLPTLKEIPLQIPMLEIPGHLPYYHDEINDIYYSDPEGENEIGNYEDLQNWLKGAGSIAKLNGNSIYNASLITAASKTQITKFKIPVKDNDYVFMTELPRKKAVCVIVNGAHIDNSNFIYDKQNSKFMINFYDDYLNTLPEGKNTIYFVGTDGNAYLEFEVEKTSVDPVNPVNPTKPSKPSYNPPKTGIK